MKTRNDLSIERTPQGILITTIHRGYYWKKLYMFFTRKEAIELALKELNK